ANACARAGRRAGEGDDRQVAGGGEEARHGANASTFCLTPPPLRGDNSCLEQPHPEPERPLMSMTSVAQKWVSEAAGMTQPSRVVWCDGSKTEYDGLIEAMLADGTLLPLKQKTYPNCYLHRSHPSDVARTEQ